MNTQVANAPVLADEAQVTSLPLSAALREATKSQHTEAEKTGVIQDILKGRADRSAYALYLRNLLPAYQAMEKGLRHHAASPGVRHIAMPALFRATALESDLVGLAGSNWPAKLPLLAAARAYAGCIEAAAAGDGSRLIAHAYTRYLGDLSGGQIIKRILARAMNLPPQALTFYDFPTIADQAAFKVAYREALDRAGREIVDTMLILDEGRTAFQCNIDLSKAVHQGGPHPV